MRPRLLALTLFLATPLFASAQSATRGDTPLQVGDYASGLAAMVDEAHVREVHLHAELAAAQSRLAAANGQIAQLQAAAVAAKAPVVPAAPAAATEPATPAAH